jgi:FG-GAP repeat
MENKLMHTKRQLIRNLIRLIAILLTVGLLALSPAARAVDPPPDGGYPGQNTGVGEDASAAEPFASAPTYTRQPLGARTPDEPVWGCALCEIGTLVASDGQTGDWFGYSVGVSGDTIVVGAYGDDAGTPNEGSVYVFARPIRPGDRSRARKVARLTASDASWNDQFGRSVAISGDTIVVGAYGDEGYRGSAYVFVKPPGGWADATETAKLTASDGEGFNYFGDSVAIDGGTIVVGAPLEDVLQSGSAYVFVEPPGGWADATETAKLTASDGEVNDNLARSVAVSGDTVVAGAPNDDVTGVSSQGSAYVFVKPPGGWLSGTETARLVASDGAAGDHFGTTIGVSGERSSPGHLMTTSAATSTRARPTCSLSRQRGGRTPSRRPNSRPRTETPGTSSAPRLASPAQ